MEIEKTVLCYIKKNDDYLFMLRNKKKNDLNDAKWIGVGGHIEPGESKEDTLLREVKEETGLILTDFSYRGELLFINNDYEEIIYLFTSDSFTGELIQCDEGELRWINKDKILNLNLWEGDRAFLPQLINGNKEIRMTLLYNNKELVKIIDGGDIDENR